MHHAMTHQTSHPASVPSARRRDPPQGAGGQGPATVEALGASTFVHLRTRQPVDVRQVCDSCRTPLRGPF